MRTAARPATRERLAEAAALLQDALSAARAERGGSLYLAELAGRLEVDLDGEGGRAPAAQGTPVGGEATPAPHGSLDEFLARSLEASDRLVGLGELDGVSLGLVIATTSPLRDTRIIGRVELLWVDKGAREVGIGHELLGLAREWAAGRGAFGVDVPALPGMRELKNLLESAGFAAREIVMHERGGRLR